MKTKKTMRFNYETYTRGEKIGVFSKTRFFWILQPQRVVSRVSGNLKGVCIIF